ncbi:ABC-2 family transporter protein [Hathewaya proteolytica DSM 3090]|uniref:ABC-2 family transporter protein n=1 Tax=Hathewaya proteolytica DSM 3090 TaxID=1121331 RepID=A0A1M6PH46_9CLOT|nr:ABC transporter permease subunit [Hathewaya proteolytica]SHK07253.1 ABC-2 family transporter protein [Hathewaya proteolytica DSM 3090]
MWGIVKLELKNFFKDKKNYVPIIILLFIIGIFVFKNMEYEKDNKHLYSRRLENMFIDIEHEYENKIKMGISQDMPLMKNLETQGKLTNNLRRAINKRDSKKYLESSIAWCKHNISMIDKGEIYSHMKDKTYYEVRMKQNEFLLKNDIEPMDDGCYMSGFNFLRLIGSNVVFVIILALLAYIGSSAYASEAQYKTYKLLYTQSVKKSSIFMGKLLGKFIISVTAVALTLSISTVVLGIVKGFGTLNYPIPYISQGSIVIITLGHYLAKQVLLLLGVILFVNLLGIIISMFIGNVTSSLITTMVVIGLGYLLCSIDSMASFTKYLPFSALQPLKILGGVAIENGIANYSPLMISSNLVTVMCFLYSILLFFAGIFIVTNKNHMK